MVIDHVGLAQPFQPPAPPDPFADLPNVLSLAELDNVAIKISGACTLSHEPFPYPDIWEPLGRIFQAYGLDRCMWGTDWTRAVRLLTYEQGVEAFRATDRLSDAERSALMGGTLTKVYKLVAYSGDLRLAGLTMCHWCENRRKHPATVVPAKSLPRTRYGGDLCTTSTPVIPNAAERSEESKILVIQGWIVSGTVSMTAAYHFRFLPGVGMTRREGSYAKVSEEPAPYSIRGGNPSPTAAVKSGNEGRANFIAWCAGRNRHERLPKIAPGLPAMSSRGASEGPGAGSASTMRKDDATSIPSCGLR